MPGRLRVFPVCALLGVAGFLGVALGDLADPPASAGAQAVAAWAAGPLEVRVAFDRPVGAALAGNLVGQAIDFGAEDPQRDASAPSGKLRIAAGKLVDDGRTLVLATDPHAWPLAYTLRMPKEGIATAGATGSVTYTLSGVEASWSEKPNAQDEPPAWRGWWPSLDANSVRAKTRGSVEHERGLALLARAGQLSLRTLLVLPEGKGEVVLSSNVPFEAALAGEEPVKSVQDRAGQQARSGYHKVALAYEVGPEPAELLVRIRTTAGGSLPVLLASYHAEGSAERPLAATNLLLPWAPSPAPSAAEPPPLPPALAGGDRARGEAVFFSEQARCSSCHKIHGKGGEIGPDLSKQPEREAAAIYRDINDPSAIVNPEFVSHTVALKDGRVAMGIVRTEGFETIRVFDTDAKQTVIKRADIEELRPSRSSIMPAGLVGSIGEAKMRDLLAFLRAGPTKGSALPKAAAH